MSHGRERTSTERTSTERMSTERTSTERTSTERMSKYECARLIGTRMNQLAESAPVLTSVPDAMRDNLLYVATKELVDGKLRFQVQRPLGKGRHYMISCDELALPEDVGELLRMYEGRV